MTDSVAVPIPINEWTIVATNVTVARLVPLKTDVKYVEVVLDTGSSAPVDGVLTLGTPISNDGWILNGTTARDIYVAVLGTKPGSIKAEL